MDLDFFWGGDGEKEEWIFLWQHDKYNGILLSLSSKVYFPLFPFPAIYTLTLSFMLSYT